MTTRAPVGPRFTPRDPPAPDLAAYISYAISTGVYRYRATVTVDAPAEVVADRVPPTAGVVEAVDATTCRLYAGANDLDGLAFHIGLLGFGFQVQEPPELIDRIRVLVDRLARSTS